MRDNGTCVQLRFSSTFALIFKEIFHRMHSKRIETNIVRAAVQRGKCSVIKVGQQIECGIYLINFIIKSIYESDYTVVHCTHLLLYSHRLKVSIRKNEVVLPFAIINNTLNCENCTRQC